MLILCILSILILGFSLTRILLRKPQPDSRSELERKFDEIGNMDGMTRAEIVAKVGQPYTTIRYGHWEMSQWINNEFHIGIVFDEEGHFQSITKREVLTAS